MHNPASQPEMFWNFPVLKVSKTDDGARIVEGYATTDQPDSSGEVVTSQLVKGARDKYMERGNLREMHQLWAAGKVFDDSYEEDENGFKWLVKARVVDPDAIKKIDEGVYTGFSIGIDRVKREPMNRKIMIGGDIVEISLVDRPHNEACNLTATRAQGAQVFKIMGAEAVMEPEVIKGGPGSGRHAKGEVNNHLVKAHEQMDEAIRRNGSGDMEERDHAMHSAENHLNQADQINKNHESDDDKLAVMRARKIQKFLSQPFFVAEQFTGTAGKYVKLSDTVKGFKMILDGEMDDVSEQEFYMKGDISEVKKA